MAEDANIKLLIDLKNLDENLIAIDIDINNNKVTTIIQMIINEQVKSGGL